MTGRRRDRVLPVVALAGVALCVVALALSATVVKPLFAAGAACLVFVAAALVGEAVADAIRAYRHRSRS